MAIADPLSLVLTAYLAMAVLLAGLWAWQLRFRNASIADVGWCVGLIATVWWYAGQASGEFGRKALIIVMVVIYAGRLGLHLLIDRVIGKDEDPRYQRLRRRWGPSEPLRMFGYFQLQALAVSAFSLPFLVIVQNPRPPFALAELFGFVIWMVAMAGEMTADRQLARFREKSWNRERVCRDGLWRFSRHPNYFFEWLQWWGYVAMGLGVPGWPLTWIGPLAMGYALLYVTGIPLAEEQALARRGEEYRQYQRTTSAFVPWFPKAGRPTDLG
jgi:steroid 5-alpha reductase family enzyme